MIVREWQNMAVSPSFNHVSRPFGNLHQPSAIFISTVGLPNPQLPPAFCIHPRSHGISWVIHVSMGQHPGVPFSSHQTSW